ncbi:hypothetical protein B0T16DRAFT_442098 [Cercophora newfieldiana]|uniref:Amidoligase enzyme-domain-containing protein n=1 Tax=Cercophora newfieldiana TaxID=92897 RepID=A0AA39YRS3_9PEZI|nr:hypothetical protein B0T16DRAFT_442098 [Cercophora newfieldiana]
MSSSDTAYSPWGGPPAPTDGWQTPAAKSESPVDDAEYYAQDTGNCLSFGLEFEFIMNWRRKVYTPEYEAEQVDDKIQEAWDRSSPDWFAEDYMKNFFREKGFKLLNESVQKGAPNPFPSMYLFPNAGWEISSDYSVTECALSGYDRDAMFPGYFTMSFEIKTPVLRACQASFDHVCEVLAAINGHFRVRVNPSCGMHVHVGKGSQLMRDVDQITPALNAVTGFPIFKSKTFSLSELRRISALLWAVDPFLAALHPPERQFNIYSGSIRTYSELAVGGWDTKGAPYPARKRFGVPGPEKNLDAEPTRPIERISSERFPATRPTDLGADARARLNMMTFGRQLRMPEKLLHDRVCPGADILLAASSKSKIAQMMSSCVRGRLNYNFAEYLSGREASCNSFTDSKGTIEFREHAGSLYPETAVYWATVCVFIVNFARTASDKIFNRVLNRLARAEEAALNGTGNLYDVISFLVDIGLTNIATWYEMRLRKMPMEHWYPMQIQFPKEVDVLIPPEGPWKGNTYPTSSYPKLLERSEKMDRIDKCLQWKKGLTDPDMVEMCEWLDHEEALVLCELPPTIAPEEGSVDYSGERAERPPEYADMIRKYREGVVRLREYRRRHRVTPTTVPPAPAPPTALPLRPTLAGARTAGGAGSAGRRI